MSHLRNAAIVALLGSAARADVEMPVAPGDKITGTLEPAVEVERFLAPLPAGAALTVKAKTARGGPSLRVRVLQPSGTVIADVNGAKLAVSRLAIDLTGVHVVEVTSFDGTTTGGYALGVTWTNPKSASASAEVAAGGESMLVFGAPAGATAKFVVRASRGSAATAELVGIAGTGAFAAPLGPETTGQATLPSLDDYTLRFRNGSGAAGGIDAAVKLSLPPTQKRKLDLSSRAVPAGVRIVAAAVVTKTGATLASAGGPTAGASVTFPAGAVKKKPVVATLGEGAPLLASEDDFLEAAGPPVFLGPEGAIWPGVSVTLPYDPAAFPDGTDALRVQTRDAAGAISEVTGLAIDAAAHTVTFETTHFSTFQTLEVSSKRATSIARLAYESSSSSGEFFGGAVAIADAWVAVGAPGLPSGGQSRSGAVFVYPFADGVVGAADRIQAPIPERNDNFGASVAVSGDVLVVGATGQFSQVRTPGGSVFVYRRIGGQWSLEQELAPQFPQPGASFGYRLAMHGTRIVVGAMNEDHGPLTGAGAAYVFAYNGQSWVREARLVNATPATGDAFGFGLAIFGDTVAVGSNDRPGDPEYFGDVTVFERDTVSGVWAEAQNLRGPSPTYSFGSSVALGDGRLVCGAVDGDGPPSEGKAFAYAGVPGLFALEDTLAGAGPLNFEFGFSCAIDGDRMLIGARGVGNGDAPGKVYSYERRNNGWKREATMRGGDLNLPSGAGDTVNASFGFAVALRGKYFLVGSPSAPGGPNANKSGAGAAFLLEVDD